MKVERIHSQHIFLFPFAIKAKEVEESSTSKERLKRICECLQNQESEWHYKHFQISALQDDGQSQERTAPYSADEIWAYNEYTYFHDYVRQTLFNEKKSCEQLFSDNDSPVSLYFERETAAGDEMVIQIKSDVEPLIFRLSIDHVSLRIFETGIGILTITLYNYCHKAFEDILLINDFGRRIYPQFLGAPPDDPQKPYDPTDDVKGAFLADKITFHLTRESWPEEFKTEEFKAADFLRPKQKFAKYIQKLLSPLEPNEVMPIIDDRMFTICWHENDNIMNSLQAQNKGKYAFEHSDEWYKYVFIDGKVALAQHVKLRYDLILNSTYPRFANWGTLFGVTRYSFVCLCSIDAWKDYPYKIIRNHMQKMYYQMCILLLAQRASILLFNLELNKIALELSEETVKKKGKTTKKKIYEMQKALENLYQRFLNFQNRMAFDEVTPQEQGIELYDIALRNMNIPNMLASLKQKLEQTHAYIKLKTDSNISKSVAVLTSLGAIFLPATFVAAIWSMKLYFLDDVFTKKTTYKFEFPPLQTLRNNWDWVNLGELIISAVLVLLLAHNIMRNLPEDFFQRPNKSLKDILKAATRDWKDWRVWGLTVLLLAQILLFW